MKTNETKGFCLPGSYRIALGATLGVLVAGACGGVIDRNPITGSESHFLAYCAEGCGPGLDCIGGICTRSCLTGQATCGDLAANAACTNQSVEPGEVAVCDVTCAGGGGCTVLGADYSCDQGFCRKDRSTGSTGSADAGPDGSSPGSGGSSSSPGSGVPDSKVCDAYRDQGAPPYELSFTNTGSVPLYIERPSLSSCQDEFPLYALFRDGQAVNVMGGISCDVNCGQVLDEGWPDPDTQEFLCHRQCAEPAPVLIQPGQTLRQPVLSEVISEQLPRGCATGTNDNLDICFQRAYPQPGNFQLVVYASRELQCSSDTDCDCRPDTDGACTNPFVSVAFVNSRDLQFTFETSSYAKSQSFEFSAP